MEPGNLTSFVMIGQGDAVQNVGPLSAQKNDLVIDSEFQVRSDRQFEVVSEVMIETRAANSFLKCCGILRYFPSQ